jgi:hypothetical protein
MKNLTYVVLALLLAIVVIAGCKKSENLVALNEKSTAALKVTDTVATPPATPKDSTKLVPLTGDKIALLSGLYKSRLGDTTYVYFVAQTTNQYCASGNINFSNGLDANNNFSVDLINAQVPIACNVPNGTITSGIIRFWQNNQNPYMVNGSYPLKVTLNGNTYTGSINISPTAVTFNWNYTSGVIITPTQIMR